MKTSLPSIRPCLAPVWARGGHAQTVIGNLIRAYRLPQPGRRVELSLDDGDRLVLREFEGNTDVVVYLFHGLGGSSDADYMHRTAKLCLDLGHSVCLVNHRGCGEGQGVAFQPYHSGRGEDLSRVFEWGRDRFPGHRHLGIGFSLSGNALLCLLTGMRGKVLPDFAITVNAPIDLRSTAVNLARGFNRVYDLRFVYRVSGLIRERQASGHFDPAVKFSPFLKLRDIDNLYTGPAGGFVDGDDYYRSCSTQDHLHRIEVPTVMLTAEDDPFVDFSAYRKARLSPNLHLHAEKTGGHMGYVAKGDSPWKSECWLDFAIQERMNFLLS